MAKEKIDWLKAKQEFINNQGSTLKDVALKFGVSHSWVRAVSIKKGWRTEKQKVWEAVDKAVIKEAQRLIIKRLRQGCKASF